MTEAEFDGAVYEVLAGAYGWISAFSVLTKLPEGSKPADLEASLKRLVDAGRVDIKKRTGNSTLYRRTPAAGEEPTAEVRSLPPPRALKYAGPAEDQLPAPGELEARRYEMRVSAPTKPQPSALSPAKGAAPEEPAMKKSGDVVTKKQQKVLDALKQGAMTTDEIAAKVGSKAGAVLFHLKGLAKAKRIHKPQGRMGPWALGHTASATATTVSRAPKSAPSQESSRIVRIHPEIAAAVAELRWSIRNDGVVTFIAGAHQLEVTGEVLDRVMAARAAIAKAA